ncbi:MAG TPA: hypothetical protein VFQ53_11160 [Kofleriaceae bacterium]|nr:hypothetical protein [Kofleriaceae bacterium]
MGRWQRYWFADGGRLSVAVVRIAIAVAVGMSLWRLATLSTVQLPPVPEVYRPVGVWMVTGEWVPTADVVLVLWIVAWVGTAAMLLGLCTRVATVVSFVGAMSLAALSYAGSAAWSHQYNVVFLAQLAFFGARGGDALSVDAVIRRVRGLPPKDVPHGYQWSLRLVQLAIALMFAGAAFHKLLHGHFTLRWALSDNLRHHLLVRYDLAGIERPPLVDWLLEDVWRYRTAALLNLLAQATPLLAMFFMRRPVLRALCGAVFALEILGLGLVVSLWNEHWLPLVAAFIDWDRLFRRTHEEDRAPGFRPPLAPRIYIAAFLVYEGVTSFVPSLDQRLNTYPFSGFPMFATIRALEPYDEHLPYSVPGDRFVVASDAPLTEVQQRWFDHANRGVYNLKSQAQLEPKLRAILATARTRYGDGIRGLRHQVALFEAEPYPAPARFDEYPIAVTGELLADGTFRSLLGTLADGAIELRATHVDASRIERLVYYADDRPIRWELAFTREGDRLVLASPLKPDPVYVVAFVDGTPWLVAQRRSWKWQ